MKTQEEKREYARLWARNWRANNPKLAKKKQIEWRENNREKVNNFSKEWQARNPEKVKAKTKRYYEENQEALIQKSREWRKNNPEKQALSSKNWRLANPQYYTDPGNRLRSLANAAKKRALVKTLTFDETLPLYLKKNPVTICQCCGKTLDYSRGSRLNKWNSPSLDRVIPELGYTIKNVQIICFRCNTIKNNATANELLKIVSYIKENSNGVSSITTA